MQIFLPITNWQAAEKTALTIGVAEKKMYNIDKQQANTLSVPLN